MVSKKKREKNKDFVKTKLKVGKTAAKPSNHTDTSFVARTISLPNQSLTSTTIAYSTEDLIKRLSLTKHHSNQTRKETLIYIEQHLPSSPTPYKQILNAITPLILDQSQMVRTALLSILMTIAKTQPGIMELHARSIVLYVHSAMTHITAPIRQDAANFMNVLIHYGGDALVRAAWIKSLKGYFAVMNWTVDEMKESVSFAVTTASVTTKTKWKAAVLESLVSFIKCGALPPAVQDGGAVILMRDLTEKYMMPMTPSPFAHLKLFERELTGTSGETSANNVIVDTNSTSCEDHVSRRRLLKELFVPMIKKQVVVLVKDGGEVGKWAKVLEKVLDDIQAIEDTD